MNVIAKFAVPAALALAAFGAQAEGFTPSAGGVYAGPTAQVSAPATPMVERVTPFNPVAGGVVRDQRDAAPGSVGAGTMSQRMTATGFLGA